MKSKQPPYNLACGNSKAIPLPPPPQRRSFVSLSSFNLWLAPPTITSKGNLHVQSPYLEKVRSEIQVFLKRQHIKHIDDMISIPTLPPFLNNLHGI